MAKKKTTETISGRISLQAYDIWQREKSNLNVPTGKLLEFLILDYDEHVGWGELEEIINDWRDDRRQKRKAYNRKQKQEKRAELKRTCAASGKMSKPEIRLTKI